MSAVNSVLGRNYTDVRNAINDEAIVRVPEGVEPLKGKKPGTTYTWQFYMAQAMYDMATAEATAFLFWQKHRKLKPFQLGALETGGLPIASAIQFVGFYFFGKSTRMFSVRKETKEYGCINDIEGPLHNTDLPVILIDDLLASGATGKRAEDVLKFYGYDLLEIWAPVIKIHEMNLDEVPNHWDWVYNLDDFSLNAIDYNTPGIKEALDQIFLDKVPGRLKELSK